MSPARRSRYIDGTRTTRKRLRESARQRNMFHTRSNMTAVAAVALAIALLNIFQNNEFLTKMLKFVVDLIGKAGDMIK